MNVWVLVNDDLNESQTANEHLIGVFTSPTDVIEEMKAQCKNQGANLADLEQTDNFIYGIAEVDDETWVVFEASLEEVK